MDAVLQLFRDLGTTKLAALITVGVLLLVGFAFISLQISSPTMTPIYSNLEMKDSAAIVTELESKNIPYELRANGTQIMVPQEQMLRLRMSMAQKGIPSKGSIVGYEIFDQSESLGTSSFIQNVNLIRALEGELSRTIGSFTNIESARVHLVVPKREVFSREKEMPTASVILQIRGSAGLSKEEVNAISHLVATAVPGLSPAKITIVDTSGKSFKLGGKDEDTPEALAASSEEYQNSYENRLKNTIEDLLEKSVGAGKVKAQVTAEINFDRIVTNSEVYDPEKSAIRSVQTSEEKESSTDKDTKENVSVSNNLPAAKGTEEAATKSMSNTARTDETTNYEVTKTVENHVSEIGNVKRISVAVLVDGTYVPDKQTNVLTYVPRSPAELKQLESLVKSAVGFDEKRKDKVEIVNMQFFKDLNADKPETTADWLKRELHGLIQTFVIAIVVILVLLLVVRPIVSRAFELSSDEAEDEELIASLNAAKMDAPEEQASLEDDEAMIDIEKIGTRVKASAFKSVNEIVEKYPAETLTVIRNWLNKD